MDASFFTNNRKRLFDVMEAGSAVILHSGMTSVKSYDQNISPFTPNKNFYYFTGIEEQHACLVMVKTAKAQTEHLFFEEPDEFLIKWNGKMLTVEKAMELSGLAEKDIQYSQKLDATLQRYLGRSLVERLYFAFDRLDTRQTRTWSEEMANRLHGLYPAVAVKNAAGLIGPLRAIKTPEEVELIKKAIDLTFDGLTFMLKNAKPGEYEYEWAADYEYTVRRKGGRLGFTTIAASGPNATMLHYGDNDHPTADGQLILTDLGAEWRHYGADITRTFPVGGKYSPRQKELYAIVREAMEISKDKMRPGQPVGACNDAVIEFYKKALKTIKLIKDDDDVGKYYYHGVSHHLGLDTHDPCFVDTLAPGMVVTNEPGLYIAEEGIGIRLENDVLITEGDPVDLAGARLLEIEDIEALMAK